MKPFKYISPKLLSEAISVLAANRGKAQILVGGTDLLNMMRDNHVCPDVVVSVKDIKEFREIKREKRELRIGAFCTLNQAVESNLIQENYPILSEAVGQIGSDQVRNRGTIGGNICNASPAGDSIAPLIVLDAEGEICGPDGMRRVSIANFFTNPGETILDPDEILTEIVIPDQEQQRSGIYKKLGRRKSMECCLVGIAVCMRHNPEGDSVVGCRIALAAGAPTPIRVLQAEKILEHQIPTEERIQDAAKLVREAATPITDVRASKEYRSKMVEVLAVRAISETISRLRTVQR